MTYERRYAGVGLERRGQRGPNDAGGVATYQSIFGALLVAAWDCRQLATAATWTDYVGGRVLTANGTPVIGADGSNFLGKSVVKLPAAAWYRGVGLTSLGAAGRPWCSWVGRDTLASAGIYTDIGISAVSDLIKLQTTGATLTGTTIGAACGPFTADTAPHRIDLAADAAASTMVVDATTFTGAASGAVGAALTAVGIGIAASSAVAPTQTMNALFLVLSAAPSAAQLTAYRALTLADFGV